MSAASAAATSRLLIRRSAPQPIDGLAVRPRRVGVLVPLAFLTGGLGQVVGDLGDLNRIGCVVRRLAVRVQKCLRKRALVVGRADRVVLPAVALAGALGPDVGAVGV